MSEPFNPAAAAAKPRPGSVTISSYLLFLVAALFVISAIVSLSTLGTISDVYKDAYEGTDLDGTEGFVTAAGAIGAVVQLLFAAAFVVLALLNNRGRNASRIVTWVVAGLGVCCTGLNLGGTALSGVNTDTSGDLPDNAELQRRIEDSLPSWSEPLTTTITVLALLALLAVVVLLALPPSNEFFRKPAAGGWEPPVPGSAYPGYPQGTPGYPPTTPPGEPGYPPSNPPGNPPTNPPGGPSGPPTNPPGS